MFNLLVGSANAEMARAEMSQEGKEQCPSISGVLPRSLQASSTSLVLNSCAPRFEKSLIYVVGFLCTEPNTAIGGHTPPVVADPHCQHNWIGS